MTTNPQEPLTYANAPRQIVGGVEYVTDEASLALAKEIIVEYKDLLDALEKQ